MDDWDDSIMDNYEDITVRYCEAWLEAADIARRLGTQPRDTGARDTDNRAMSGVLN